MKPRWTRFLALLATMWLITLSNGLAGAATNAQFGSATNAIVSAFVAVHNAGQDGVNVSDFVTKLNVALDLVGEAQAENATNPMQATADLTNATSIAESVTAASASAAQSGSKARQVTVETSIGAASAIVIAAALIYAFGDRIFRRLWLFAYGNFVVRPANG
jgi:hypothetical protein